MKHNSSPGEQSEAPRRRWKPWQEQHLWATRLNLHVDTRSALVPILNKLKDLAPNPCTSSQSLFRDCSAWPKVLYAPSRGPRSCHMSKYSVFGPQQPFGRTVVLLPLSSIGCRLGQTAQRAVCAVCRMCPWHTKLKLGVPERHLAACTNCSLSSLSKTSSNGA